MPSLLAFYQPSDSGVTAGQAPSSTGLQWHARHQIVCARAGPKGEPSGINKSASAKSMLISCKWSRLNFNKLCQHIHVCSLNSSAAHSGAALQSKKKRKKWAFTMRQVFSCMSCSSIKSSLITFEKKKKNAHTHTQRQVLRKVHEPAAFSHLCKILLYSLRSIIHSLACISNYQMSSAAFQQLLWRIPHGAKTQNKTKKNPKQKTLMAAISNTRG